MKIHLATFFAGAIALVAFLAAPAAAQTAGAPGTANYAPIKNLHKPTDGVFVPRPGVDENMAGFIDELARIEAALKTLERALAKAVANHDQKKARELRGILVDLKGRKQRVLDAMAETVATVQMMAAMPPTGWTFEYYLALARLEEIARKEGMDRSKFNALRKRLAGLMEQA